MQPSASASCGVSYSGNFVMDAQDLTAEEWDLLADNALLWSRVLPPEGAERYRKRARDFKAMAAKENHDQSLYEADGTVILRKPAWLPEVIEILEAYRLAAEEDNDGVTILAVNVVLGMLEFQFEEEEE